jgi:UDP-N-acetylmuramoylalanine--D-glutamate ligase
MTDKQQQLIAQLKTQNIVVLGAGLTGLSCVRFLQANNVCCRLNDNRLDIIDELSFNEEFPDCQLAQGKWQPQWLNQAEVILISPGIDIVAEQLTKYIADDCLLMGDVELFCRLSDTPIIAVTGSNGKSTVVSLLAHIANELDINAILAGNIGLPILDQIKQTPDCIIAELSSFQLETLTSMKAFSAAVLNISDDHLDRHQTREKYSAIKQSIYQQCQHIVINRDDRLSWSSVPVDTENMISFGSDQPLTGNFGLIVNDIDTSLMLGDKVLCSASALPLAGRHNALNYLAALALGMSANWPLVDMVRSLHSFKGLPHRCQRLETKDDIVWINDSKATNVGACIAAIEGMSSVMMPNNKMILIAGGDGKGEDFNALITPVKNHVEYLITLGLDGNKIGRVSQLPRQDCFAVNSIEQAVDKARHLANKGDVILLSPACASIDMFANFAERGQRFTAAVHTSQESI